MSEEPNQPVYCEMAQLTVTEMEDKCFEQIKFLIDKAKENGSWLLLIVHDIN